MKIEIIKGNDNPVADFFSSPSSTPETDDQPIIYAMNDNGYQVPCVDLEFARKLERERAEALEDLEFRRGLYKVQEERLEKVMKELAEAREEIKELIYIAERAIALAEIDFENDKFGVVSELRYELKQIMQEGAK
jgi:hypothetical protein